MSLRKLVSHSRNWNCSEPIVLLNQHVALELKDLQTTHTIPVIEEYTKTLGIEWNVNSDYFHIAIADLSPFENSTKRLLVSDVAKTFDVLVFSSHHKGNDSPAETMGNESGLG